MQAIESLAHAKWLLERFDALRSTTSSRASVVISADAIIIAASTFIFDKIMPNPNWSMPIYIQNIFLIITFLTFLFAIASALCAVPAVAALGKFPKRESSRLFFSSSETVERFRNKAPRELTQTFQKLRTKELLELAFAELNENYLLHHKRYNWLRRSLTILYLALGSLFLLGTLALILILL